jgi:predicted Zn finger-like uncharacterized protein
MADDAVEPLITECPSCRTRFRVTEAQLTVASGRVRCGACLNVFRGADHLVLSMDPTHTPEDPDAALDALLSELSEVSAKHEPKTNEPTPVPRVIREGSPRERNVPASPPQAAAPGDEPRVTVMRDVPRRRPPRRPPIPPALRATAEGTSSVPNEPIEAQPVAPASPPARNEPDAPLPEMEVLEGQLPEALETAPPERAPLSPRSAAVPPPGAATASKDATQASASPPPIPVVQQPIRGTEPKEEPAEPSSTRPRQRDDIARDELSSLPSFAVFDSLRDPTRVPSDPLGLGDLPFGMEPPVLRRRRRWMVPAILLALLVLAGQVLWFQYGAWSRDPQIRPVYEWLCALVGCEIPPIRAPERFSTKNLIVRSHPERAGALVVDALIVNDAPFAQPFPQLELRFSAVDGNLVAARRFSPNEYLAGEAAGMKEIPARTPVHITLEVEDPGVDPLNYVIMFR